MGVKFITKWSTFEESRFLFVFVCQAAGIDVRPIGRKALQMPTFRFGTRSVLRNITFFMPITITIIFL
jgi:hypothetical protein